MNATGLLVITCISLALAVAMTIVAWRISRRERRRAEARIAALASEIHGEPPMAAAAGSSRVEVGIRGEPSRRYPAAATLPRSSVQDLPRRDASTPFRAAAAAPDLFAGTRPESARSRIVAGAGLGVFIVAAIAALAIVLGGVWQASPAPEPPAIDASGAARAPSGAPLELSALTHERDGDRLMIKGVVRNPSSGAVVNGLDAVVAVFDRDGQMMTSARAPIERTPLAPGGDSRFVVSLPNAADVGRYRVSFRIGDRTIAHVDRRDRAHAAREQ